MKEFLFYMETLISGMLPFIFLIFCGLYLTVKSGFFQFRYFGKSMSSAFGSIFGKKKGTGGVSPFQAACTALSATVGTGNIAGVAGAISIGGAGAVFWMWVSAVVGMCVKVIEIVLSVLYREKRDGEYVGGPMYYIKNGLPKSYLPLAYIFAFTGIFSTFCTGNITQTNAVVESISGNNTVRLAIGVTFAVMTAVVIIGGSKRIGAFTEKIVPLMAVLYFIMSLGIIFANYDYFPKAISMIMEGAFNPNAVTGGLVGSLTVSIMAGASRGVFSNEAGLGTSAMAHSSAENTDGVKQSLFGIFEVFIDTIVLCTLTALTILCSRVNIDYGTVESTGLVQTALSALYGKSAFILIAIMMFLFGISSIIGWGLYGSICSGFLLGRLGKKLFILIYPLFCIAGAFFNVDTAWRLSAFFNGIMLCVNVAVLVLLSGDAAEEIKKFKRRQGK